MQKILLCIVLVFANSFFSSQTAQSSEVQNKLYVSGNSPKETRTSVAQGGSSGFGLASIQSINLPMQVSLSEGSAHVLDALGNVWGWGSDGREVGTGSNSAVTQPRMVPINEKIVQIASGNNHSLALSNSGRVFAWGWNGHGQIGLGTYSDYSDSWRFSTPTQVTIPGGRTIKSIAAGGYQSYAIATDNTIWGWGINENYSILGTGGYASVYTPTLIRIPNGVIPVKLSTDGGRYTLVVSQGGGVIGWGSNGNNGNGLGISGEINSPALIFPEGSSIVDIAVNGAATFLLTSNGIVYSAGYNGFGQLGSPNHPGGNNFAKVLLPSTFRAVRIFAANSNGWAVGLNGQTYTWGAGSNDTLGTGYTGSIFTPILLSTLNGNEIVSLAGNYTQTFAIASNQYQIEAAAEKAAAEKAAAEKAAAEKAAAEKAAAEKAAAELKAKEEAAKLAAEVKALEELKAKEEAARIIAEAKEIADKIIAEAKANSNKKTAILCVKGKLTKKVIAVKPKCPVGYKKK